MAATQRARDAKRRVCLGIKSDLIGNPGGLVGVFMVSCGPSMYPNFPHFPKCVKLVER
jgi:hypothetical protein